GWMLDAMDVMLYAFALGHIREEFGLSAATAGALASVTLLSSAAGGIGFGVLADRYGRARMLRVAILTYSAFTALTATSGSVLALVVWRTLVGFGLGGEWSAGSVLVAETWPARHRGKAAGIMQSGWAIGYILAAGLAALVIPRFGWRPLFVLGVLPALLVFYIRRNVPEPSRWQPSTGGGAGLRESLARLGRPPLLSRTIVATAMSTFLMFAYWGLFTWVPAFLASPVEQGGAGMGIVRSSGWIVPMQLGALAGYLSFGFLADRFGRRPVFLVFVLSSALLVPLYGGAARLPVLLMVLGPLIGFFGHGYFSIFGAMLAELFPTGIRGMAQGLCYNAGRAVSALAPYTIGAIADARGLGAALGFTSLFYLVAGALIFGLPETRGAELE
ncbi:MAG: MFS transporter, partial [Gemmatimonadota bacterium]|nr:MFS transporter [Gemmatimonadota bacterium]